MEAKQYKVGLIKSLFRDYQTGQVRGMIETMNDSEKELPFFMAGTNMADLKEGKMVKFVKESSPLVSRAVDVARI